MKFFRIAKAEHIGDLTGEGARVSGGRWNEKGISVIYASESLSLAALEYLVHLPLVLAPPDLKYRSFSVPDDTKITNLQAASRPQDWDAMPFQDETVRIGSGWARSVRTLILRVPSVIVPGEYNFIINPHHTDFRKVKASRPLPFNFDDRILKRKR